MREPTPLDILRIVREVEAVTDAMLPSELLVFRLAGRAAPWRRRRFMARTEAFADSTDVAAVRHLLRGLTAAPAPAAVPGIALRVFEVIGAAAERRGLKGPRFDLDLATGELLRRPPG